MKEDTKIDPVCGMKISHSEAKSKNLIVKKDGKKPNGTGGSSPSEEPKPNTTSLQDKNEPQPVPPEDVQLLKAVEMLKSWKVFKQIRPAA